jgi:hypothetical protein
MSVFKKIFIMPYFGDLPEWYDKYEVPKGYDLLLDTDLESFKERVRRVLGIEYPGLPGTGKVWDYRSALGLLYAEEIKGYDFWGHTDFDVVYGNVDFWVTDKLLSSNMVHSNHHSYVNGCWTLYRNCKQVNELFMQYPDWKEKMIYPESNGWVEEEYSRILENSGIPYIYTFWQGNPYTSTPNLQKINGKLYQDGQEICMFHFRRSKSWPLK